MIEILIDILAFVIAMGIVIWIGIFSFKIILSTRKNKKKSKEAMKLLEDIEKSVKSFYNYFFFILSILIKMVLSAALGIGSKPIILMLNAPLGEGYATFASYIVAIGLFVALPNIYNFNENPPNHDTKTKQSQRGIK